MMLEDSVEERTNFQFAILPVAMYYAFMAKTEGLRTAIKRFYREQAGQVSVGIVSIVIGFIIVFYVIAYTYKPLEDAGIALKNNLQNATITGVSSLSNLPEVAVLLFVLITILGLVLMAARSGQ